MRHSRAGGSRRAHLNTLCHLSSCVAFRGGENMTWNTRCAILVLVLLLGSASLVFGATQNAVIYGTVYNAKGNPMPDATVVLENKALGFSRTTTTGSDGSYNFAEVPPADGYAVTAKVGARTLDTRAGVTVNVGDERV